MMSKVFFAVFWGIFCCTQGVFITNLEDYCTKVKTEFHCKGLNFGSSKHVEFNTNYKLDGNELYFVDSDLFTIPKNAFRVSKPVYSLSMRNCGLREIYRYNFDSGVNNTSTEHLSLDNNYIERIPGRAFELLLKLRTLSLSNNTLKTLDPDCFVGLPNVTLLYLNQNNLQTLPNDILEPLQGLEQIHLEGNKLEYLPRNVFSTNKKLRAVWVTKNNLKVIDINVVKDPVALQFMVQQFNRSLEPTNIGIWNHPSLTYVDVAQNYVPYLSRHSIPKTTNLDTFIANHCHLTTVESGVFSSHIKLQKLVLSYNELDSFDVNQLSTMKNLQYVDFRSNKLKDFDFRLLADNNKLKTVYLGGNPFPCKLNNEIFKFFKNKTVNTDLKEVTCS